MQASITRPTAQRHIEVIPMKAALGTEVRCGDVRDMDEEMARELRDAWYRHMVLLIRGQTLTDPELIQFGRHFGELLFGTRRPAGMKPRDERVPEINVISNVMENGLKIGNLGDSEATWHTDRSHQAAPLSATILYALEIPPTGGDTSWGNMYAAFDTLPKEVKQRISKLTIRHDESLDSAGNPRADYVGKGADHPIVRTHPETGCSALYLGRKTNSRINGLPQGESEALLDYLWAHATQSKFVWRHQWKVGDLLIWDNRCTIHHRQSFDPSARRIMHRLQVKGTPPIRADDALFHAAHPRCQDVA